MWRKMNLLFLLGISVLIDQTMSASLWHLEEGHNAMVVRDDKRKQDVYRGVLLSYSIEQKNQLCQDYFHAQLYSEENYVEKFPETKIDPRVTDDSENSGDPTHTLQVKNLTTDQNALSNEQDIFFECAVRRIKVRKPVNDQYFLSSAFRSGWMYVGLWDYNNWNEKNELHLKLDHYMGTSPKYEETKIEELEKTYFNIREIRDELAKESPEYMDLIERKNNLLTLTKWQQLILCDTILSSPAYRDDDLKGGRSQSSRRWLNERNKGKSQLVEFGKSIKIKTKKSGIKEMKLDCIICQGWETYNTEPDIFPIMQTYNTESDIFPIIQSYDNKDSVYVLSTFNQGSGFFFSRYFSQVHVLINARELFNEKQILQNYRSIFGF